MPAHNMWLHDNVSLGLLLVLNVLVSSVLEWGHSELSSPSYRAFSVDWLDTWPLEYSWFTVEDGSLWIVGFTTFEVLFVDSSARDSTIVEYSWFVWLKLFEKLYHIACVWWATHLTELCGLKAVYVVELHDCSCSLRVSTNTDEYLVTNALYEYLCHKLTGYGPTLRF